MILYVPQQVQTVIQCARWTNTDRDIVKMILHGFTASEEIKNQTLAWLERGRTTPVYLPLVIAIPVPRLFGAWCREGELKPTLITQMALDAWALDETVRGEWWRWWRIYYRHEHPATAKPRPLSDDPYDP